MPEPGDAKTSAMFRCKDCNSTQFQLVIHPDYDGLVEVAYNEFDEVVISVNQQEFVADLPFMNQFAVCRDCGAIKSWEYYFPKQQQKKSSQPSIC